MIEIDAVIDSNKNLPPQYDTIVCLEAIMFLRWAPSDYSRTFCF